MTKNQTSLCLRHLQAVPWSVFLGFWKFCKLSQEGTSNEMALKKRQRMYKSKFLKQLPGQHLPKSQALHVGLLTHEASEQCTSNMSGCTARWLQGVWKPNSETEEKWHLPVSLPVHFVPFLLLPTHWLPALLPSLRYEHLATGKEILGYGGIKRKKDQINSLHNTGIFRGPCLIFKLVVLHSSCTLQSSGD